MRCTRRVYAVAAKAEEAIIEPLKKVVCSRRVAFQLASIACHGDEFRIGRGMAAAAGTLAAGV